MGAGFAIREGSESRSRFFVDGGPGTGEGGPGTGDGGPGTGETGSARLAVIVVFIYVDVSGPGYVRRFL